MGLDLYIRHSYYRCAKEHTNGDQTQIEINYFIRFATTVSKLRYLGLLESFAVHSHKESMLSFEVTPLLC